MNYLIPASVSLAALTLVGGYVLFTTSSRHDGRQAMAVIDAYVSYQEYAAEEYALINAPGHGDNEERQKLLVLLTRMLTEELDYAQRLALAREAHNEIERARKNINEATAVRERVAGAIQDFERELGKLTDARLLQISASLLEAMHARQATVNDITATLYAINGQAGEIVERIILDNGSLTDEHIRSINDTTALAESRFDRLRERYKELAASDNALAERSAQFAERAF